MHICDAEFCSRKLEMYSSNFHISSLTAFHIETVIKHVSNLASASTTNRTPCGQIVLKSSHFCTELEIEGLLKQFLFQIRFKEMPV